MFIRKSVIEKVGYFDEGFRFYFEDMDFSLRVRAASFDIRYVPTAVVYRKLSASVDELREEFKEFMLQKNRIRLIWRNVPMLWFTFRYPMFWVYTLGSIVKAIVYYRKSRSHAKN